MFAGPTPLNRSPTLFRRSLDLLQSDFPLSPALSPFIGLGPTHFPLPTTPPLISLDYPTTHTDTSPTAAPFSTACSLTLTPSTPSTLFVVGLKCSCKCLWSCCLAKRKGKLRFGEDRVKWEPTLTFVGTCLDLNGSDHSAMERRIVQVTKVFHKRELLLTCKSALLARRIDNAAKTVVAAAPWLSEG